jgi:hypothetical protein
VKNDAYLKLDAALQVATGATAMSAEHELSEHPTKLRGEKDLQSVLEEGGRSTLSSAKGSESQPTSRETKVASIFAAFRRTRSKAERP